MLTVERLKKMEPHTIFASGEFIDDDIGINVQYTGQRLRWVAVRGGIHDWTIYYHRTEYPNEYIAKQGDKMYKPDNVKRLVSCDEDALNLYRL